MTEQSHGSPTPESQPQEVSREVRRNNARVEIDRMLAEGARIRDLDEQIRGRAIERLSNAQAVLASLDEDSPDAEALRQQAEAVFQELDAHDERMKAWTDVTNAALISMTRIIEENRQ